jgi:hypothetical protein
VINRYKLTPFLVYLTLLVPADDYLDGEIYCDEVFFFKTGGAGAGGK